MPKIILTDITNIPSSANALNQNFAIIEDAFLQVLARINPNSPNSMEADIDMNSKNIYNCKYLQAEDLRINGESFTDLIGTVQGAISGSEAIYNATVIQANLAQAAADSISTIVVDMSDQVNAAATSASLASGYAVESQNSFLNSQEQANIALDAANGLFHNSYINVKDAIYGAIGDGVTDDTAAIQAANDAAEVVGGRLFFPDGIYKFTSITVDSNYTNWVGTGRYSSILKCVSATGGVTFTGTSLALCSVQDLGFYQDVDSTDNTSALLKTNGVFNFHIIRCHFNGYNGASNYAHNLVSLNGTSVYMDHCSGSGGKTNGILISGGNDYFIDNCTFNLYSTTGRPLLVDSVTQGAVWISNSALLEGDSCRFYNSRFIQVLGTYFDSAQNQVDVSTCEHIYFNGCEFANRPGGGVAFTSSKVWSVVNSMVINCGTDGIQVNTGCSDFIIANNIIDGNNTTNTASLAGINIGIGISGFQIVNNRIGNITTGFSGHQKYGIAINVGASDYYTISNNTVTDNETAGIADNGTGTHSVVSGNIGYNPVTPSAFYAGASPYTYTAGHAMEIVYINSGTVSAIVVDGVNIFQSTDNTVVLQPNKTVTVYHTVAPLMLVSRT